jgi:hypothetical protein
MSNRLKQIQINNDSIFYYNIDKYIWYIMLYLLQTPCTTRNQQAFLNFMKTFYEQTQKNRMYLSLSLSPINRDHFTRSKKIFYFNIIKF